MPKPLCVTNAMGRGARRQAPARGRHRGQITGTPGRIALSVRLEDDQVLGRSMRGRRQVRKLGLEVPRGELTGMGPVALNPENGHPVVGDVVAVEDEVTAVR